MKYLFSSAHKITACSNQRPERALRHMQSRWPYSEAAGCSKLTTVLPSAISMSGKLHTEILAGEFVEFYSLELLPLPVSHP